MLQTPFNPDPFPLFKTSRGPKGRCRVAWKCRKYTNTSSCWLPVVVFYQYRSISKHQSTVCYFKFIPGLLHGWFNLKNDDWKKVWFMTQYTSVPHTKWPCSRRQRHKHCQRQNGRIQGGVFANFKRQCLTIVCYKNNRLKNWRHTWNGLVHDIKDTARQNSSIYGGVFANFKHQCLPIVRYKNNRLKNWCLFFPELF